MNKNDAVDETEVFEKTIIIENQFGKIEKHSSSSSISLLIITHQNCTALLSLFGGQVLSWQPIGHEDVFWLSCKSKLNGKAAIRGGVPICWPWFGGLSGEPNHGFARIDNWLLSSVDITEQAISIELTLSGESQRYAWPFYYKVIQKLSFSTTFKQELIIENLTQQPLTFSNALHSYFVVSSPCNVTVPELSTALFDDCISGVSNCPAQAMTNCSGPVDRIYHQSATARLVDSGLNRVIEITKVNSNQWVLWNPGKELASTMSDVHQGGEQEFVCLEAANTELVSIEPLKKYLVAQEINIYNL